MKKWLMLVAISLFLISFVVAISADIIDITGGTVDNSSGLSNSDDKESSLNSPSTFSNATGDKEEDDNESELNVEDDDNEDEDKETTDDAETARERIIEALKAKNLTDAQMKAILVARNRIKFTEKYGECPVECECSGSTVKCTLASGREMTVIAGKSGNVIVQIKGVNMTTNVTLYKSEDKIYGIFKNNETKIIRMLPDQVKERIRERIEARLQNENITLNDGGEYEYQAEKRARLFAFIPVRMMVRAEIDAETGEVIELKAAKWWGFLARDEKEDIVGASCGTVTPGYNDACCQNKGFDVWSDETGQCEFSE